MPTQTAIVAIQFVAAAAACRCGGEARRQTWLLARGLRQGRRGRLTGLGNAEPLQEHQRRFAAAGGGRASQQLARIGQIAGPIRLQATMQQFVRFPLPFGERSACPLDICARAAVAALEKRHTRPDVHGLFESPFEVVVEPGEEKPLDQRLAIRVGGRLTARRGAQRLGHAAMGTEARLL